MLNDLIDNILYFSKLQEYKFETSINDYCNEINNYDNKNNKVYGVYDKKNNIYVIDLNKITYK